MAGKIFGGFVFNPVENRHKKKNNSNGTRKSNKKFYCVCTQTSPDEYIAVVKTKVNNILSDITYSFSPRSYELKGKEIVFTKNAKLYGQIACIRRTKEVANSFPGLPEQYTPFRNNWIYSGYIIKLDGKEYFDITETIGHVNQNKHLLTESYKEENNEDIIE